MDLLKLVGTISKQLAASGRQIGYRQQRRISALFITDDKAMENYVTLQPYMDFKSTLTNTENLQHNIVQRRLQINVANILEQYSTYKDFVGKIQILEEERQSVTKQLKELLKSNASELECDTLKDRGKSLRNDLKLLKQSFYPIEDEFVHVFLNLPNELHPNCPTDNQEKVLYRSSTPRVEQGEAHLKRKDLIRFIDNTRYYMMESAAEFDVYSTQAMTRYFVNTGDFIQSANPDFVRSVLLEANATPIDHYHMVKEENLQNKLNAAYLTGGGAFESFLGAVTKLCVYPKVLPLRYVASGRSYLKVSMSQPDGTRAEENLFTATQTNAVQTFVATTCAADADHEMEQILNYAVNFYNELGIHFRIVYADASELTASECLRAVIEVYSPALQRYICVGSVSNYSNFVSKRILFTMREQNDYKFLHLVGGPVLYTTRLIAALIENGKLFEECKLLGAFDPDATEPEPELDAIGEFKNIFK